MPKVSNINLKIDTPHSKTYDIHYQGNSERRQKYPTGFYVLGLPADFNNVTDIKLQGYSTENELRDALRKGVTIYKEFKETSRKVILYKAVASAEIRMNKFADARTSGYTGFRPGVSDKIRNTASGAEAAEIGISFQVAIEKNDGAEKQYLRVNNLDEVGYRMSSTHEYTIIDWTPEREKFFEGIYEGMYKMLVSMSAFFGADAQAAALFIDNNQKLLG